MTSEDLRDAIQGINERFDFGEYEIEAYLAVLEGGELTASEIAERTDIPQPRVYDTVRELADRGLVELRESRPMRAVAIDPEEVFPPIQDSLEDLVEELASRYAVPARDIEAVSLVRSRPTIQRYLGEVIEAAEYELTCSLTPALLERFEDELAAAVARDVTAELLVAPLSEAPDPAEYDYRSVATVVRGRRGVTTPVLAVADGEYSVYATQAALRAGGERYGVIFNRSALGFLVSGFFSTVLWSTARPLAADGGERSFPRYYASVRRCLTDLQDTEDEFHVEVTGRDVETGTARRVEGRLVGFDLEAGGRVASLSLETDRGRVDVGGRVAALEDVEAHEIYVSRVG